MITCFYHKFKHGLLGRNCSVASNVFMKHLGAWSPFRLFSGSIGGYMGLLIGASLITLFEFLDFIVVTVATHLGQIS